MMAEGYDWIRVQTGPCPLCAFDPMATRLHQFDRALEGVAGAWGRWLLGESASPRAVDGLRVRPDSATWSSLEYGCHVRDVLEIFGERIERALTEDTPDVGWWDHEAAVTDRRYNDADPMDVAVRIATNTSALAGQLSALHADDWNRSSVRRGTEEFTVSGQARFCLHEAHHHLRDAQRSAGVVGPLLHIATAMDWEAAGADDTYFPTDPESDGFIHCCEPGQLDGVLDRWFPGRTDLVVVELDPYRLTSELRWNESHPGNWFPHLHGPVNRAAVTATRAL